MRDLILSAQRSSEQFLKGLCETNTEMLRHGKKVCERGGSGGAGGTAGRQERRILAAVGEGTDRQSVYQRANPVMEEMCSDSLTHHLDAR